jgi:hypothetical protein
MKKYLLLCVSLVLITGSKKSDPVTTNTCAKPSFTVSSSGNGSITVNVGGSIGQGTGTIGFTRVEYDPNGFTRGSGTTVTGYYNGTTLNNMGNGTYDVYVQVNCGGGLSP